MSVRDIDPFQPEFSVEDDFRFLDNYMGAENIPAMLLALGHEGPNFEENRRYFGKIKEYITRTWDREEIPPSRIIPLSIRNIIGILTLRSHFPLPTLAERLYTLVSIPFVR